MSSELLLWIIIGIVLLEFGLERVLNYLNRKRRGVPLPENVKGLYDAEKYQKSQEYAAAKDKIGTLSSTLGLVGTLVMLLGGFAWLNEQVVNYTDSPILQALIFFGILGLASDLISTPFSIYNIFVIEEKFGFNKMTPKLYAIDKVKGWVLGGIIGGALLSIFVWFYQAFPDYFWLYAWGIFMAFALFMAMFYTNLIVPLFNKLSPLEEGTLRNEIEKYAASVNFPLKKVMVLDGSKRSTKANAYFSGLGGAKNIVLFDTLIEKQNTDELVAVLAHEVGHYKKKHTFQGIALSAVNTLLTLYILGLVIDSPLLSEALGASQPTFHLGLIAFTILYSPLSTVTGLLMNVFSRKNEYEADAYAAQTASGEALMSALKKLSVDSLSNLTPHPAYVFFYYSHPPLSSRMQALSEKAEVGTQA